MSLTGNVKTEICETALPAELAGAFQSGVLYGLRTEKPSLTTELVPVRDRLLAAFGSSALCGTKKRGEKTLFVFRFGEDAGVPAFPGGDDLSTGFFLRGVFLSCGTVSVQKAGYHLELSLYTEEKCGRLLRLINEHGMNVKRSSRAGVPFLYTKNSECAADFLTYIGAAHSAMEIMNIKIYKDFRSGINRVVNCEAANLGKTVAASAEQIAWIRAIEEKKGLGFLSPELRELARARRENPDVSLSELGRLLDPPLSRSGVNHRLERLKKIAEELKE